MVMASHCVGFTLPGMILYIAGIGAVYITTNFLVVSSASKSDQGAVAGVFNVALQVGGSVLGLAVVTAVAQGVQEKFGKGDLSLGSLSKIGYESVYYTCAALSAVALLVCMFAIEIPEGMRGSLWMKRAEAPVPLEPRMEE